MTNAVAIATMKAITYDRYGSPDVLQLREMARPVPKDKEVLIRVESSVATLAECAFRAADPFITRLFTGLLRPKAGTIPGDVVAGVVDTLGPGATRWRVGDRVFGTIAPKMGAHADYLCLPQDGALAAMPAELSFDEAAALVDGFLTALPFLRDEAKLRSGQKVLINGASGSIGTMAVQLAKAFGAEVTGVCSSRNLELVTSLGADQVIDYTQRDFAKSEETWDVIFDTVGKRSFKACKDALAPGGVYMTTVPSMAAGLSMLKKPKAGEKRLVFATTGLRPAAEKAKDLLVLVDLLEAGKLRAVIDRRYGLAEMATAHAYVETERKRGSLVITIGHGAR